MMEIPYSLEPRPDTGFRNGQFGMWLFLASEVMLFGGLFSAYALLRGGAAEWPHRVLNIPLGAANTVVLAASSVAMVLARRAITDGRSGAYRGFVGGSMGLALVFLANKTFEYRAHLQAGDGPWTSTFYAIYFTITGVHALHLVGGMIAMAYLFGPGARLLASDTRRLVARHEAITLYWNFVDVVWVAIFATLYLA